MQLRCYSCHTPFALSREAVRAALDELHENEQQHHNAYCPRCRKANRVARQQLLRAAPDWVPPEEREEVDEGE